VSQRRDAGGAAETWQLIVPRSGLVPDAGRALAVPLCLGWPRLDVTLMGSTNDREL